MAGANWDWKSGTDPDWVPADIDTATASVARIYDYYLGGKDNFGVDREAAGQLDHASPGTRALAINNRRFLMRAVRYLAEQEGVRQFIDHGSGLPTQDNVHTVAQQAAPESRVVYVDNDPIVLAHGRALLADNNQTTVIQADMRHPEDILGHPETGRLINLSQPVGLLFLSVLHCVPDSDEPAAIVRRALDNVPSGSFLVLSHLVSGDEAERNKLTDLMLTLTAGNWGRVRAPDEVSPWFNGLEVVEPGLTEVSAWRPDPNGMDQESTEWIEFGGVARKP